MAGKKRTAEAVTTSDSGNGEIVILGLGSALQGDDAVGLRLLERLKSRLGERPGLSFVDGGTLGLELLPLVESASHLLALDAVDANQAPGSVVVLRGGEIAAFAQMALSGHQTGLQQVLGLAAFRGALPQDYALVGVQYAGLEAGDGLSAAVQAALGEAEQRALDVLSTWGCG